MNCKVFVFAAMFPMYQKDIQIYTPGHESDKRIYRINSFNERRHDKLSNLRRQRDVSVAAIHGDRTQTEREEAVDGVNCFDKC